MTAKAGVASGPDDWQMIYADGFWGRTQEALAKEFALLGNHPNPFNASTVISYDLPITSGVKLEIFNLSGQKVATLVDGQQEAGYRSVGWDARDVASGVYLYKLSASDYTETKTMMLIK